MSETPYREPAEMPAEPSEPVWPKIWAALKRLGLLVLITAGPVMSTGIGIGIYRAFNGTVVYWILYAAIGSILFPVMKSSPDCPEWVESYSWPGVVLLTAWAPFALPLLGLYRVASWVRTGK